MKTKTFTIIELLVVIAIIGILSTILIPSLSRAREKAKRAVCASNQQQIYKGHLLYSMDYNGYYAPSNWIFKFEAKVANAMGLLNAGKAARCPNYAKDQDENLWQHTDTELVQSLANNDKVQFGFHLLTGSQSFGSKNGGSGFTKWEKITDDLTIPLIVDRTVSPSDNWGTKISHTKIGWSEVDVSSVLNIGQYGCEGQNETSSDGATKWVSVGNMKAFSSSSILGFWSDDY